MYQKREISLPMEYKTKPRDQKLEAGKDFEVISRTFSYFLINNGHLYHLLANLLAHNKEMNEKFVFREALSLEMSSQSLPVSCFRSRGFVHHRKWNFTFLVRQNSGKENRYRIVFCYTYQYIGEILSSKKNLLYTLKR